MAENPDFGLDAHQRRRRPLRTRLESSARGRASRTTSPRPTRACGPACSRNSFVSSSSCGVEIGRNRYRRRIRPPVSRPCPNDRGGLPAGRICAPSGDGEAAGGPASSGPVSSGLSPVANILAALSRTIGTIPRVLLRETELERRARSSGPVLPRCPPAPADTSSSARSATAAWAPSSGARPRPGPRPGRQGPAGGAPRRSRAGPPLHRGGADRRTAPASGHRTRSTSWAVRRRPAVLHHEAGQGPHAGRAAGRATEPARRTGRGCWRSSSRSARRWPTPTPGA